MSPFDLGKFLSSSGSNSHGFFPVLGQHYFVENPSNHSAISPKWDFTSSAFNGNNDAFVITNKTDSQAAPTGKQDVDWLKTKNVKGKLADEVYRTETRGGQPPDSVSFNSVYVLLVLMSFCSAMVLRARSRNMLLCIVCINDHSRED
jgi:hypothetical protein